MSPEIASLLGAIIGGIATYSGVLATQRKIGRREREAAEVRSAQEALVAARLLQSDLAWAKARMDQAIERGKYWSEPYGLTQEAWVKYRERIASALGSEEDWSSVRDGFRALRVAELQAARRRGPDQDQVEVNSWGRRQLELGLIRVATAIDALQPVARDRPREPISIDRERPEADAEPAQDES